MVGCSGIHAGRTSGRDLLWGGVLQLRATEFTDAIPSGTIELRDAPLSPTRVVGIRQAWRGSSCCFFSPSLWMSDEELDAVAARVKGCTASEIGNAVCRAETAAELLEACKAAYGWSQSSGDGRSEQAFAFQVLPKLQGAIRNAERSK